MKSKTTGLSKRELEIIAETVHKQIRKEQHQKKKEEQDNRLFNTKLLIRNYRLLKAHCEDIPQEVEEFQDSIFDPEKLSLETLMREKAKTYNMMVYVDIRLDAYRQLAKSMGIAAERRYNIVDDLFLSERALTGKEIQEKYSVAKSQMYRDRDKAFQEIAVLLFGMAVLEFK